jgi:hypothetical protein
VISLPICTRGDGDDAPGGNDALRERPRFEPIARDFLAARCEHCENPNDEDSDDCSNDEAALRLGSLSFLLSQSMESAGWRRWRASVMRQRRRWVQEFLESGGPSRTRINDVVLALPKFSLNTAGHRRPPADHCSSDAGCFCRALRVTSASAASQSSNSPPGAKPRSSAR